MLTKYHVVLLKASSCGVKFHFSICPFWSESTYFNLWIDSLHILYHVKMLSNILARFWISCDIYSAVKFRTVFPIAKAEPVMGMWSANQIQGFRILAHWDSPGKKPNHFYNVKQASNVLKFELKEDGTKPRNKGCTGVISLFSLASNAGGWTEVMRKNKIVSKENKTILREDKRM